MKVKFWILLGQYIIFYTQYGFVSLNPLVGNNIRLARTNEFSFIVSLMRINHLNPDPQMDHICMGSLISRKHILTSEHCISTESPEGIQIIVGSTNLCEGNAYFIYWWISYDQWATVREFQLEFLENDVAIIRLLNIVPATINLARISAGQNTDFYNIVVQTVGWGSENDSVANNRLQAVSLHVITKENCESRIGRLLNQEIHIEEQQTICTIANPYALLSWGDSGGPLLNANSIIAINRGICPEVALGDPNIVNYHISIAYYRPFILELLYFSFT